jgi:DNA-binding GntR family transcriptional regulator
VPDKAPKKTRAAIVGNRMREEILAGRLRPGQRLMFPDLCRDYEASVGAIREALVWLVGQGLVKANAHQGYVVTPLSQDDLLQLTEARLAVEPIVLRDSISKGDIAWESRVVTAHHVMMRTPREDAGNPDRVSDEWAAVHEAFHSSLFSGSENRRLLAIVDSFGEEAALYRRWTVPLETDRDVAAEHAGILEAAIDRDADLAIERLCAHISYTTHLLLTNSHEILEPSPSK